MTYALTSRREVKVQTDDVITINKSTQSVAETDDVMVQAKVSSTAIAIQCTTNTRDVSAQTETGVYRGINISSSYNIVLVNITIFGHYSQF